MPIKDLQRRGRQIGEIRLGMTVVTGKGKKAPTKLDAFRFTTESAVIAKAVADLYGGEAINSELNNGKKTWEVITSCTELQVIVPSGDAVISQWYEMWSAAGCARRCDGETNTITGKACECPLDQDRRREMAAKGTACKPVTRVNVMLPDLPDIGVWKVESHGYNAAVELGDTAELMRNARNAGVVLSATLRLSQRESRKVGETPKKFAVPVLELNHSLREMTQLEAGAGLAAVLPPAPPQAQAALGTGSAAPVVDLRAYIVEHVPTAVADDLRAQWRARFPFPADRVPRDQEPAVRRLVRSYAKDDEVIDAEVVDESDPGRPF